MNCTLDTQAIATAKLHSHLEKQVREITPERIKIKTPQRKAKYHDKTRIRLADIKALALRDCRCADTADMKRRLQVLGVNLDLRYTSSWVAIVWELQAQIKVIPPAQPVNVSASLSIDPKRTCAELVEAQLPQCRSSRGVILKGEQMLEKAIMPVDGKQWLEICKSCSNQNTSKGVRKKWNSTNYSKSLSQTLKRSPL